MTVKEFVVKNRLGLHARPAALFVKATTQFRSSVKVEKDGQQVDGKSIMGLMMLAAEEGSTLTVRADGEDEKAVLDSLETLFKNRFDEKD